MESENDNVEIEVDDVDYSDDEGFIQREYVSSVSSIDLGDSVATDAVSLDEDVDSYEHDRDDDNKCSHERSG